MFEVNLLVVGSSEVRMFWEGRQYLQQEYGIRVRVDYQAGAVLEESLRQIKRSMKPNTQILIIWALTPYAWKRTPIRTKNKWDTTIFRPSKFLSIENVPGLMNHIMRYVLQVNPYCSVYLSIPAIKDMYCFNESRLVKAWGENYRDYHLHYAEYNPEQMRTSSVRAYSLFCSLKKPHYHWEEKQLLFAVGIKLITPTQQHGYTLYPHVSPFDIYSHNTNPFLLPSTFPSSCSHHMINPDAQAWVREYMNDRKRKGHERKLKRLHDLEELSLAIDQEKEITKRLRR
ncbi:UNVERIFIED_CONTAM: hypothetical protein RMT77_008591 [Armadillidium vulgare]